MILKTTLKILLLIIIFYSSTSQSQSNKFELKSLSFGGGIIKSDSETSDGGLNLIADLTTNSNKNLFSVYINSGSEIALFDYKEVYREYNLTYGRETTIKKWFKIEGHIGIGYFEYDYQSILSNFKEIKKSTIGIPFRLKFIFYTSDKFGLGLNPNLNINSLVNTYNANLIFQYHF